MRKATIGFLFVCLVVNSFIGLTLATGSTLEIIINVPQFKLYLYENQILVREYPIGVGNELKPSVLGKTEVINRVVNPTYYPPRWWERGIEPIPPGPDNPVGTRWIGLGFSGYGIHGTNNPSSIGKAMSSGCIRMHNADVEELMAFIPIGTPVSLIYQTIILNQDPLLNTKSILIYPDIYRNSSNTLSQVKQALDERHWTNVHLPALESMVTNSAGVVQPLPMAVDIAFNNEQIEGKGVKYGKKYYVPLEDFVDRIQKREYTDYMIWDKTYVDLVEFTKSNGFVYVLDDTIEIFDVELVLFEDPIGIKAFYLDNQLYFPVEELSQRLGLPIPDYLKSNILVIDGKNYLDLTAIKDWGFIVDWEYPLGQARLKNTQVYLEDKLLGMAVKDGEGEIYLPITPILDLIELSSNSTNGNQSIPYESMGAEIMKVGDEIYVPEWVVRWLMPGAQLKILDPKI